MGYNESISELVSELWKLRNLVNTYKNGKHLGVTITKTDFKIKASSLKDSIQAKIDQVKTDVIAELSS